MSEAKGSADSINVCESASRFFACQGQKPQEYFVYFKNFAMQTSGKCAVEACAGIYSAVPKFNYGDLPVIFGEDTASTQDVDTVLRT